MGRGDPGKGVTAERHGRREVSGTESHRKAYPHFHSLSLDGVTDHSVSRDERWLEKGYSNAFRKGTDIKRRADEDVL